MKPFLEVSMVDGKVVFGGLAWYIIQTLRQFLRFNVELQTTDEQIWSGRRPTGEWGGPLGMLERNESDVSAHGVIPTADRLTVGTPLPAYVYANPRYYAGTPNAYMTSVFGYLMSFDLEVWLGLLLCWPLVSVLISFIEAVRSPIRFKDVITANLFDILGVMMFEGTIRPVRDVVGRVIFSVWWLAVLVLMNSFQGTMKASMSVRTPTERLETFRDLAERPHLKPIIIRGTTFEHQFKVSPEKDLQKILAMAHAHRSIMPASAVFTRETFDEMILKRAVIFMEDNVMQSYIATLYPQKPGQGIIYASKQHTISAQFCMFMRKTLDPRIMKLLHTRCRWMHESGLTERKRLQLLPETWYLARPSASQVHSLTAEDTAALFYMVMLGLAVALATFIGELILHCSIFSKPPHTDSVAELRLCGSALLLELDEDDDVHCLARECVAVLHEACSATAIACYTHSWARCRWMHESGLTERKRLQLLPETWYLARPSPFEVHSLSASDTAALFYMVILGQAAALVVFFVELLMYSSTFFIRARGRRKRVI